MLKMNVSNMCKEVHRVRVLYVHVFVSVYNFLRWNKIIKYKKKKSSLAMVLALMVVYMGGPFMRVKTIIINGSKYMVTA